MDDLVLELKQPELSLELIPQITLQVNEALVEEVEEVEDIDEEEAQELGLYERTDATRIASGDNWEILIEPLNYVLREGGKYSYFNKFEYLLDVLKERRIKYYLSEKGIFKIEEVMDNVEQDIHNTLLNIRKVLNFLDKKYSITDMGL